MAIKLTGPMTHLFSTLQEEGVRIAICTADSREGTEQFLARENLKDLVDTVVCGDDKGTRPKPSPHNAYKICKELGVSPADTIMVGDTPADTLMGQQVKMFIQMCLEANVSIYLTCMFVLSRPIWG